MNKLKLAIAVALASFLTSLPCLAGEPASAPEQSLDECAKYVSVFKRLNLPGVVGKPWVVYNTGAWSSEGIADEAGYSYDFVAGWLVSASDKKVEILTLNFETVVRGRKLEPLPDYVRDKIAVPKGLPEPRKYIEADFGESCRGLIENTVDGVRGANRFSEFFGVLREGLSPSPAAEAALRAFWALEIGLKDLAVRLVGFSMERFKKTMSSRRPGDPEGESPAEMLSNEIADCLRCRAIICANQLRPRAELLALWETIGRVAPGSRWVLEAKEMIRHYGVLIEEDAWWKEPAPEALSGFPAMEKAGYWIHHLRDHAAMQGMQPGQCNVLRDLHGRPGDPNPAAELIELGWFAIPHLIDRLDDSRPTRSLGYWRDFSPDSFYLLRMGDCCQQILEAVTGVRFYRRRDTNGYPVKDGTAAEIKSQYSKWWAENAGSGPEEYHSRGLESNDPDVRVKAARVLLKADAKKLLAAVLSAIKVKGPGSGGSLLEVAVLYMDASHEPIIEAFLKDKDDFVALVAARFLLEKCGSERGAAEILERLQAWPEMEFTLSQFPSCALVFLARTRDPKFAQGVAGLFRHRSLEIRRESVRKANCFASQVVAEALVSMLGDSSSVGLAMNGVELRACDLAAGSLRDMVCYPPEFQWHKSAEDRDKFILGLAAWWKENREKLDWADLAKKATERAAGDE